MNSILLIFLKECKVYVGIYIYSFIHIYIPTPAITYNHLKHSIFQQKNMKIGNTEKLIEWIA